MENEEWRVQSYPTTPHLSEEPCRGLIYQTLIVRKVRRVGVLSLLPSTFSRLPLKSEIGE